MRIVHLTIENFQGLRRVDLSLGPVTLINGHNGAGKSSICEAIRLALTGQAERVELKKEYLHLVRQGAKSGSISVTTQNGAITVALPSGTAKDTLPELPHIGLALEPSTFARLSPAERKTALFSVLGLSLTGETILPKLAERKCDADKVAELGPLLKSGFEAAAKRASERVSEARGAWKAVTGENYGSVKAGTWKAHAPLLTSEEAAELTRIDAEIKQAETALADARKRHGAALEAERQVAGYAERLEAVRLRARGFAEHDKLVQTAAAILADVQSQLADAQEKAGQAPAKEPATLACPECAAVLVMADGKLAPYVAPEPVPYDPQAAARIPKLEEGLRLQRAVVDRHKANRADADRAAIEVKTMEDNLPQPPEIAASIIEGTVLELAAKVEGARARGSLLRQKNEAAELADGKTKAARLHHRDVEQWSLIAEALSPSGIPGEIVGGALNAVNDRLREHATDTGWMQAAIGADMEITAGGRRYRSLSKSEKWRTDAMLAETIAHLSGMRMLVLDEFDIIEPGDRGTVLNWLDDLAQAREIDTVILAGTLKSSPSLPDHPHITPVRIDGGDVVVPKENQGAPVSLATVLNTLAEAGTPA